jgi:FKBP-type peptidyl-prolyl cis-trans isomerase FkpA
MRQIGIAILLVCVLVGCAPAEANKADADGDDTAVATTVNSDDDKTLYALGFALATQLQGISFEGNDLKQIQQGLADGLSGSKPAVAMETYGPMIQTMMATRVEQMATVEAEKGAAYVEEAAATPGAIQLNSGGIYLEITAGEGAQPAATDRVKIHYHGTLQDGTVFDSSVDKGVPAEFGVNEVVPCFSEGVQQLKVGAKAKLVCPSLSAYPQGRPPLIKPGAVIQFEVELLEILNAQ